MIKIKENEYALMKEYIEENCGIHLVKGKEYLIESRLADLLAETGSKSFLEFLSNARKDGGKLRDRIIDAMTTNETLWFRDDKTWTYLKDVAVPSLLERAETDGKVRIWSAAASTGQEAYSLMMLIDEVARAKGKKALLEKVEIVGTDISSSALFQAITGRYDAVAMNRGLTEERKSKYFSKNEKVFIFSEELKKRVRFKQFNLQGSFSALGSFNLILCRYVLIYFSKDFKAEIISKVSGVLKSGGTLLLGGSENMSTVASDFTMSNHGGALLYTKK